MEEHQQLKKTIAKVMFNLSFYCSATDIFFNFDVTYKIRVVRKTCIYCGVKESTRLEMILILFIFNYFLPLLRSTKENAY